ncbi:hypothetical protein [Salinibaculum rarum]|uniref:hypothetical protein n=1 Tax=Salinibaculum rarum TaxID=3058903 RepID=UPI00265E69F6|nr:hypothetical protein [Salinibaculum sp. KK48]
MRIDPNHDCNAHTGDSGWDSSYCPSLPEHDIITSAKTNTHEFYLTGNGDVLIYHSDAKERVLSLNPEEANTIKDVSEQIR